MFHWNHHWSNLPTWTLNFSLDSPFIGVIGFIIHWIHWIYHSLDSLDSSLIGFIGFTIHRIHWIHHSSDLQITKLSLFSVTIIWQWKTALNGQCGYTTFLLKIQLTWVNINGQFTSENFIYFDFFNWENILPKFTIFTTMTALNRQEEMEVQLLATVNICVIIMTMTLIMGIIMLIIDFALTRLKPTARCQHIKLTRTTKVWNEQNGGFHVF